jgi:hypothetical protein
MNINTLFSNEVGHVLIQSVKEMITLATNQIINEHTKPLSRKEAADFLSVDVGTLNRWELQGIIKSHFLGGKKMYLKSELIGAIKAN